MSTTDESDETNISRPNAYWLSEGNSLTLYVKRRARACADPWLNHGVIYGASWPLRPRKDEHFVLPLSQPILDEIEARLALPTPAPVIDERSRPIPELRRQLAENARYYNDKGYLETENARGRIVRLLNEAHASLNKAAVDTRLTAAANDARFACADALRVLEGGRHEGDPHHVPDRAADAIKSAVQALHRDDPPAGSSMVLAYTADIYAARGRCDLALEYLEKDRKDTDATVPVPVRRTGRRRDPDRER